MTYEPKTAMLTSRTVPISHLRSSFLNCGTPIFVGTRVPIMNLSDYLAIFTDRSHRV